MLKKNMMKLNFFFKEAKAFSFWSIIIGIAPAEDNANENSVPKNPAPPEIIIIFFFKLKILSKEFFIILLPAPHQ